MQYDLKIGIGGMVPHPMAGFGGGSKIILPGLAGIDTVTAVSYTHLDVYKRQVLHQYLCPGSSHDAAHAGILFAGGLRVRQV